MPYSIGPIGLKKRVWQTEGLNPDELLFSALALGLLVRPFKHLFQTSLRPYEVSPPRSMQTINN